MHFSCFLCLFFMFILNHQKCNVMSSRYIPRIKGVKSMEQFERGQSLKGKSLTESNSVGVNFPGRLYLILQRRTYEKFKYEIDFIFIYCRYFHSLIFVSAPSLTRLVIICLKMSPKMGDFRRSCFPGNYFVSN